MFLSSKDGASGESEKSVMPEQMWQRPQMLVEDTQQKIERQRAIITQLEQRILDTRIAQQLLQVWEETFVRRIEIRDQMQDRARRQKRRV